MTLVAMRIVLPPNMSLPGQCLGAKHVPLESLESLESLNSWSLNSWSWGCFSVVRLHVVIALCSKSSSISETPSHVAAGHYWPAIPSSQNSLSSSSSSSSSSSLVYHPLRKGSRREMRTPSFISISQAVECCKGIQNFFQNFFTTSSSSSSNNFTG